MPPDRNPYEDQHEFATQVNIEEGIIIDPVTGRPRHIGGRIDRLVLDPATGQYVTKTTHVVVPSADGEQLQFPFAKQLFQCEVCKQAPLTEATRCVRCQRYLCGRHRIKTKYGILCVYCLPPWWKRFLSWWGDV